MFFHLTRKPGMIWHDRAVLHFLNSDEEIETYFRIADKSLSAMA
jgi:hypothetical protein